MLASDAGLGGLLCKDTLVVCAPCSLPGCIPDSAVRLPTRVKESANGILSIFTYYSRPQAIHGLEY